MIEEEKANWLSRYLEGMAVQGLVDITELILVSYKNLGMTDMEAVILMHLWHFHRRNNLFPSPQELQEVMAADAGTIRSAIAGLIEKKLLVVKSRVNQNTGKAESRYSFARLFALLAATWSREQPEDPPIAQVMRTVEKEFGRPLSPMEVEQIAKWCGQQRLAPELVLEAVRRTVLQGVYNFRYIDSILQQWVKNNVRTLAEVAIFEERHPRSRPRNHGRQGRQPETKEKEAVIKDKYEDVYMT